MSSRSDSQAAGLVQSSLLQKLVSQFIERSGLEAHPSATSVCFRYVSFLHCSSHSRAPLLLSFRMKWILTNAAWHFYVAGVLSV